MKMLKKQRTAAYARVSADSAQMLHSAEAQAAYYRELIAQHTDWEFAGIYADVGISGMDTRKRSAFKQMIADCEAGRIDVILVKSVSRFARNTLDVLRYVRLLKTLGVAVWFEEQQINSLTEEGELMLTLMASIAQAESEAASENAKWAIRRGFQNGIGNTRRRTFGYEWCEGRLTVVPEEAKAVRQIFANYLAGISHRRNAEALAEQGITSIHGKPFSVCAISGILRNITYTGNLLLQKTYVRDPISKKKMINTGELPQYLVKNNHEAIIDMETYLRVQEKFAQNKKEGKFPYNRTGECYPFTGKVVCGCCGRHYTRQLWNTSPGRAKRAVWVCVSKKMETDRRCEAGNISEKNLMEASAAVLGLDKFEKNRFLEQVKTITVLDTENLEFALQDGTTVTQHLKYAKGAVRR